MIIPKTPSQSPASTGKTLNDRRIMKVKITRIDKSLPLPKYHTKGSVAFDIYAREDTTLAPKEMKMIPTNLIIATPRGYMLMIAVRSSTGIKKGMMMVNGVGIVDQDYRGPDDECLVSLINYTKKKVLVERGERIAQGLFIPIQKAQWTEIDRPKGKSRGGYGSTGHK